MPKSKNDELSKLKTRIKTKLINMSQKDYNHIFPLDRGKGKHIITPKGIILHE